MDSVYPHLAPHIVVTPPEYTWEDYFIPFQNRIDPQWHCYLTVPPQTWHARSSTHVPRSKDRARSKNFSLVEVDRSPKMTTDDWPLRIFSHEEFAESVGRFGSRLLSWLCAHSLYQVLNASEESLVCVDLGIALQRHQAKANVSVII